MTPASSPAESDTVDLHLPFTPESAGVARQHLASWLENRSRDHDAHDDARLVVSELVGNAVRHARPLADGTMQVTWADGPRGLDIAVTDGGARTTPERLDADVTDISGRGLSIVETLSARWWVETSRSRTTVHALLALV